MFEILILAASLTFSLSILKKILPARGVKQITTDELKKQLRDETIQFIDVRRPIQYNQFHIYGFKNIPLRRIRQEADTLSKDKKTIVICQTGSHGNTASKRLKRKGFTDLENVRGGISTWN